MSAPQPVNAKEQQQQPHLQENLLHGSIQKRIMVVDDDLDIVTVLQSGLIKAGFFIAAYTNPRKALSDYKPRDYDHVLLDVRMPGMSGYELYAELKKLDASIKVIFLTAFDVQQEIMKMFPELDVKYILQKPVEVRVRVLVEAIRRRIDFSPSPIKFGIGILGLLF